MNWLHIVQHKLHHMWKKVAYMCSCEVVPNDLGYTHMEIPRHFNISQVASSMLVIIILTVVKTSFVRYIQEWWLLGLTVYQKRFSTGLCPNLLGKLTSQAYALASVYASQLHSQSFLCCLMFSCFCLCDKIASLLEIHPNIFHLLRP